MLKKKSPFKGDLEGRFWKFLLKEKHYQRFEVYVFRMSSSR